MSADILSPFASGGQAYPAAVGDFAHVQNLSFTTTAPVASNPAFNAALIALSATAACWIAVNPAPTAAKAGSGSFYLPPNIVVYLALPDSAQKVSVIGDSASGTLSVLPALRG